MHLLDIDIEKYMKLKDFSVFVSIIGYKGGEQSTGSSQGHVTSMEANIIWRPEQVWPL